MELSQADEVCYDGVVLVPQLYYTIPAAGAGG